MVLNFRNVTKAGDLVHRTNREKKKLINDDDWAKLTKEQRSAVSAWHEHAGKVLRAHTDSIERDHPELIQEWTLQPKTFIRDDHPEKWPPAVPEKEVKMVSGMSSEDSVFAEDRTQKKTVALKALRVTINTAIAQAKSIAGAEFMHGAGVSELSEAITYLKQARMWAGEALGEIGHKLPEEYRDESITVHPLGVCWVCGQRSDGMTWVHRERGSYQVCNQDLCIRLARDKPEITTSETQGPRTFSYPFGPMPPF